MALVIPTRAPVIGASDVPMRSITGAEGVMSVYVQDWGLGSHGHPSLVVAVWSDGRAVWSHDRNRGGGPYQTAKLPKAAVRATLVRLKRDGVFGQSELRRPWLGAEPSFTTVFLRFEGQELQMRSWHEPAELSGLVIATESGLEPLRNASRFHRLREQSSEYLFFRFAWNEVTRAIFDILPVAGEGIMGKTVMERGVLSWHESPGTSKRE
jgi:hypothetical protein